MKDNTKLIKGKCPECGGILEVDKSKDAMICPFCGIPYIVEKAINNYTVETVNIEKGNNININVDNEAAREKKYFNQQKDILPLAIMVKHTNYYIK